MTVKQFQQLKPGDLVKPYVNSPGGTYIKNEIYIVSRVDLWCNRIYTKSKISQLFVCAWTYEHFKLVNSKLAQTLFKS